MFLQLFSGRMLVVSEKWLTTDELAAWVRLVAVLELLPGVLDADLRRHANLTHFEYYVLAMLSEAPERTLRMTRLAAHTNATLPRLSHVVRRLEDRGLVERFPCSEDGRATNARLTSAGWGKVQRPPRDTRPASDSTSSIRSPPNNSASLTAIANVLLQQLDPTGAMTAMYHRHDNRPYPPLGDTLSPPRSYRHQQLIGVVLLPTPRSSWKDHPFDMNGVSPLLGGDPSRAPLSETSSSTSESTLVGTVGGPGRTLG